MKNIFNLIKFYTNFSQNLSIYLVEKSIYFESPRDLLFISEQADSTLNIPALNV